MNNILHSFQSDSVFLHDLTDHNTVTITSDRLNYRPIIQAIANNDEQAVRALLQESNVIKTVTNGRVTINDDIMLLDGKELHQAESDRLINIITENPDNVDRWYRFIEKLHDNPSYNCRQQAYNFIKHKNMPTTDTGNIIGYKGVRDDYKDKYSGKFDNSVGQVLEMKRTDVDDNPDNGCSSGFHVGSYDYANSWANEDGRLMIVEYNPADIVSVPNECDHGKLRVSKYKVVAECTSRVKLNNGSYGYDSNKTLYIWELIDGLAYGMEPYRIPIDRIQERYPDADTDLILTAIREHSDYLASITFDDGEPSEVILNS
jgi:hypothetical protein